MPGFIDPLTASITTVVLAFIAPLTVPLPSAKILSIPTLSTTLILLDVDSLYNISISVIFKSLSKTLLVDGSGILNNILFTLFSIKSTVVVLKVSSSSCISNGGLVSTNVPKFGGVKFGIGFTLRIK